MLLKKLRVGVDIGSLLMNSIFLLPIWISSLRLPVLHFFHVYWTLCVSADIKPTRCVGREICLLAYTHQEYLEKSPVCSKRYELENDVLHKEWRFYTRLWSLRRYLSIQDLSDHTILMLVLQTLESTDGTYKPLANDIVTLVYWYSVVFKKLSVASLHWQLPDGFNISVAIFMFRFNHWGFLYFIFWH